jgi:hypothetical protein
VEDQIGVEDDDEGESLVDTDDGSVQDLGKSCRQRWGFALITSDVDLDGATMATLTRLLRSELVQLCESRGIEVGGTKPQLAKALLEWVSPSPNSRS